MHKCPRVFVSTNLCSCYRKEVQTSVRHFFIGIAVSFKSNVVYVMDKNGDTLCSDTFLNFLDGANLLFNHLGNDKHRQDVYLILD